jgi:hypothetical protein
MRVVYPDSVRCLAVTAREARQMGATRQGVTLEVANAAKPEIKLGLGKRMTRH